MIKKKKQRKKIPRLQPGGYKRLIKDVYETLLLFDIGESFPGMSTHFKRMIFDYKLGFRNPVAANAHISSRELKLIREKTKKYYRQASFELKGKMISNYQLHLIQCYATIRAKEIAKLEGNNEHPEALKFGRMADELLRSFYSRYMINYFRIITQLSSPNYKYYGVKMRPAYIYKENPKFELVIEIFGFPANKQMMAINDNMRPVFRLGKADGKEPVVWISLKTSLLKDFYSGEKQELDVFIQSHALKRLKERLDLLDNEAINYALWENTHTIEQLDTYRGYLLLPFKVFDVKIGYMVANVIDEKLLFRTFLFITHNSTPEGDRLKEITGLGKHDISYWRIDRLSTFVKLKEKKYPGLMQFFSEAGLSDLMQLKDKKFNIDTMQEANLDGLAKYLNKGMQGEKMHTSELNAFLNG